MELYNMLKNISGKNNEEELIKSISLIKEELYDLTEERMCKVYNGYLFKELRNQHVPARLINTLDLGLDYEHEFVLVPSNEKGYFLADLTFSQFNSDANDLELLLKNNYQSINDSEINHYFSIITNKTFTNQFSVEDTFYSKESFSNEHNSLRK